MESLDLSQINHIERQKPSSIRTLFSVNMYQSCEVFVQGIVNSLLWTLILVKVRNNVEMDLIQLNYG